MKTKIDWEKYEKRVAELENEGLCRSDAQSVADVEFAEVSTPRRRPSGATPGPWTDSTGIHGSGWDQAEANARLIAAAPDLLEACLWLISRVPTNSPDGKSQIAGIEAARAAIAKAEGRGA